HPVLLVAGRRFPAGGVDELQQKVSDRSRITNVAGVKRLRRDQPNIHSRLASPSSAVYDQPCSRANSSTAATSTTSTSHDSSGSSSQESSASGSPGAPQYEQTVDECVGTNVHGSP